MTMRETAPDVGTTADTDAFKGPIGPAMSVAFPTPIVLHDWPDSDTLNTALTELILAEEKQSKGVVKSNVGGWHSGLDFLHRDEPPLRRLLARVRSMTHALIPETMSRPQGAGRLQLGVEGWANILRAGEYNTIHNHPNSTWSGVYYVTGNQPSLSGRTQPFAGKLEFVDPRPGASIGYVDNSKLYGRCMVEPQAGRMVMFPSWLQHFVHPCAGAGERISIAFNVMIRG
ncbi:MAG: 2OG-Fe(II) oxygenase family protein [Alphaproteobacteria bacterium]